MHSLRKIAFDGQKSTVPSASYNGSLWLYIYLLVSAFLFETQYTQCPLQSGKEQFNATLQR